jgi:protein SCO1
MSEPDQGAQQESGRERAPRVILWGILGLALVVVLGLGMWSIVSRTSPAALLFSRAAPRLPVYAVVPDFQLMNHGDQPVQCADLWGNIWVVDFIFTHCPDECPLMTTEMARLQSDMAGMEDFRSVSITVDPERDTPTVLSQYAARFHADPERWLFLTGEKRAIHRLARDGFRLGIVDPTAGIPPLGVPGTPFLAAHEGLHPPSAQRSTGSQSMDAWFASLFPRPAFADHGAKSTSLHSTRFVLVDRRAQIRGYYDSLDQAQLQRLREHLQIIQREA